MTRIHGLDLARALAIIGMMIAHIGPTNVITRGHPSVLFAVLAGVSMGIIASRAATLHDVRVTLLVRGILLVVIGVVVDALQAGILVVLIAIGASYLLLAPVVHWSTRSLAVLLGGLLVLGPLLLGAQERWQVDWHSEAFTDLFFGSYPLSAWLLYTLVGLLVHRLTLDTGATAWRELWLLSLGLLLLALSLIVVEATGIGPREELSFRAAALTAEPHTGGLLDMIGSTGVALAVIAACLLLCRVPAAVVLSYPLRALGSMSFTVYVTHVIITTIVKGSFVSLPVEEIPEVADPGWEMYVPGVGYVSPPPMEVYSDPFWPQLFVWQLIGFLVAASLWRLRFRRGPVEWGVSRALQGALERR